MIINIKVIPRAKRTLVKYGDPLRIYVNQPPEDGRANNAVIKLLAKHFKISKSKIKILKGEKHAEKIIELLNY